MFSSSRAASRKSAPLLTSGCHRSVQNILPRKSAKCLQNLLKDFLGAVERWGKLTASRSGHFQAERPDCVQAGTAGGRGASPKQGHIISVSQRGSRSSYVRQGTKVNTNDNSSDGLPSTSLLTFWCFVTSLVLKIQCFLWYQRRLYTGCRALNQ